MNIFELFDQPVPYEWENLDDRGGTATFQIGDNEYQVMVYAGGTDEEYYPDEDELPEVDIEFCRMVNNKCVQDITGGGNASQVFATVVAIMQEYISSHPVGALMFSAKEQNRGQLYMRMIKRLLPTWKITRSGGSFYATPNHAFAKKE
jgi:hypothetical protein